MPSSVRELSLDDEEEVVVDDGIFYTDHLKPQPRMSESVEKMIESLESGERYLILPKSDSLLLSVTAGKDTDGVEDSLLEGVPSSLGSAYSVAPNSTYSSVDFPTMDAYIPHLNTTYVYDTAAYQTYYQSYQPNTAPSPTSSYLLSHSVAPPSDGGLSDDDSLNSAQHAARASPATIAWLKANYEKCEGKSLPRCMLYNHYKKHCQSSSIDPVNAASFGKLIRSIFDGLRTRRLGTRGNSKYHYYGIKLREGSSLQHLAAEYECDAPTPRTEPKVFSTRRSAAAAGTANSHSSAQTTFVKTEVLSGREGTEEETMQFNGHSHRVRTPLGASRVPHYTVAASDQLDRELAAIGLTREHLAHFVHSYHKNCNDVLNLIRELTFDTVFDCWRAFWRPDEVPTSRWEYQLTQAEIFNLCQVENLRKFVIFTDFAFLQILCETLVSDVLATKINIPEHVHTKMRNFARSVENSMRSITEGAPAALTEGKVAAARMFAQNVRRYTSLSHLSNAARLVFNTAESTKIMAEDFGRVDLANVQEQAEWVTKCDATLVRQLSEAFKENLTQKKTLDDWAEWMASVVDQVLAAYHDRPYRELARHSKQFLLNWSFYSSIIIRDLTLRSASSFGHFHLIRLLFDEYLLYLVEGRLAKAAGAPVLAVMASNLVGEYDPAEYSCIMKVGDDGISCPLHTISTTSYDSDYRTDMDTSGDDLLESSGDLGIGHSL